MSAHRPGQTATRPGSTDGVLVDHESQPLLQTSTAQHGVVARGLLRVVHGYQAISPSTVPKCRYLPTCSEYAATAIERHGAGKGAWLSVRRLCRCHPFASHGHDPVPPVVTSPSPSSPR